MKLSINDFELASHSPYSWFYNTSLALKLTSFYSEVLAKLNLERDYTVIAANWCFSVKKSDVLKRLGYTFDEDLDRTFLDDNGSFPEVATVDEATMILIIAIALHNETIT